MIAAYSFPPRGRWIAAPWELSPMSERTPPEWQQCWRLLRGPVARSAGWRLLSNSVEVLTFYSHCVLIILLLQWCRKLWNQCIWTSSLWNHKKMLCLSMCGSADTQVARVRMDEVGVVFRLCKVHFYMACVVHCLKAKQIFAEKTVFPSAAQLERRLSKAFFSRFLWFCGNSGFNRSVLFVIDSTQWQCIK